MYINSAYLNNSWQPLKDKSKALVVSSCGTYRLSNKEKLPTWWARGRVDYQLLYVSSGKAHFYIKGEDVEVTAGHMILYQPKQVQHYEYFGRDNPEVYWVHFTGSDVKSILKKYGIPMDKNVFRCGSSGAYAYIYKEMIHELRSCKSGYTEMLEMYLKQILTLAGRSLEESTPSVSSYMQEEMEIAGRYLREHYNEPISIDDYAKSRGMSISWFLRNFRQFYDKSPMQYLISVRMENAAALLESTTYNISEIAAFVGYDNPLYFSRLFHKHRGLSPTDYRKSVMTDRF